MLSMSATNVLRPNMPTPQINILLQFLLTKKYFQTNDCNKDEIYAAHLLIFEKVIRIFLQQIGSSY